MSAGGDGLDPAVPTSGSLALTGIDETVEVMCAKIRGFFEVSEATAGRVRELCRHRVAFEAGRRIVHAGEPYPGIYLLSRGWVLRSRTLEHGGRQVVNAAMPGDVLCLNAMMFGVSDFDLITKTDAVCYKVEPAELRAAFQRDVDLAAALFWVSAHEECILAERIVSLGRRSARVRMAHVLAELLARLDLAGGRTDAEIDLPLTQEDLADVIGVSVVHANKTLRTLEAEGVVSFRQSRLNVLDRAALERMAGFEAGYLHFTRRR